MILLILTGLSLAFYYFLIKPLNYWRERNVPYTQGVPLFGNAWPVVFRLLSSAEVNQKLCQTHADKRYVGMHNFTSPILLVQDPELIKQITVKEFETFPEHRPFIPPDVDPLWSKNLFAMEGGERWHEMRATLSPSFTSSKMKGMFVLMRECSKQFTSYYLRKGGMVTVELKDAFSRFTTDVIATTGFGIKCDSLEEPSNEFYVMGGELTNFRGWKGLIFMLNIFIPTLAKVLKLPMFNKSVSDFFRSIVSDTIRTREEQNIVRPDMIHLLMQARAGQLDREKDASVPETGFATVQESEVGKNFQQRKDGITNDDITAQVLLFFFAGFDSVSTMMCYAVYELTLQPELQARLRREVDEAFSQCGDDLTYDVLMSMKYLDQVICETLRKWPSFIGTNRRCARPFLIQPKRSGESVLYLESGSVVSIPIFAIQRDPKFYPNPEKFDPGRFSEENKNNIVPYTYLPFGAGPRNCIGSRFALMEGKLIVAELIRKFEFVVVEQTKVPIVLSKTNFNPIPDDGFWVGLKPRTL
uniref:Cytochrome P450 n=2 Tax=Photinus pyralis TaxID=7054 RepID=A0A1Y1ML32_PHOPY